MLSWPNAPFALKRRGLWLFVLLALLALFLFSVSKGRILVVQGWAQYLWQIDYEFGFIRRALLGSTFQLLFGELSGADRNSAVLAIHYGSLGLWFLLVMGCYLAGMARAESRARLTATLVLAAALAGPAVATLSYNTGLADLFMQVLALLALIALLRKNTPAFLVCGLTGPFVHEAFLFIWMPLGCFALIEWLVHDTKAARTWVFASFAPAVSWVLVEILDDPAAAAKAIALTDLDSTTQKEVLSIQLGFTLDRSFETMHRLYSHYFQNFLVNAAYFLSIPIVSIFALPSLSLSARRSAMGRHAPAIVKLLLAAAILGPAGVLIFAWDLSRFLTWTGCSLILTILFVFNQSSWFDWSTGKTIWTARAVIGGLGGWFLLSPLLHNYFDEATAIYMTSRYVPAFQKVMTLPPAHMTFKLKDYLNRNRSDYLTAGQTINACKSIRPRGVVASRNRKNCRVKVREGDTFWSDTYHLSPGAYKFEAVFPSNRKCAGGEVSVVIRRVGRHGPAAFASATMTVQDNHRQNLNFKVNRLLSGLVQARLIVTSKGGCVILRDAGLMHVSEPS